MWCTAVDVAAEADPAVKAATGRTRPSKANRILREGVTGKLRGLAGVAGKG